MHYRNTQRSRQSARLSSMPQRSDSSLGRDLATETLPNSASRFTLRSPRFRVELVSGPDARRSVKLAGPRARVGSGPDCDLIIHDSAVSRHHLTLHVTRCGIRVIDNGSSNGTIVDGVRIADAYARPDSAIVVGRSTLRLTLLEDEVEVPLSPRQRCGSLRGLSVPMRRMFSIIERLAPTDITILIEGETGSGKELVAEAVHENSDRAEGPFVVFDCSAVTENLIESALFGHVRGAFTGAVSDARGAVEAAEGGTLFLDEIGELPLALQPKLLRLLERQEVRRVGTHERRRVDVRIVAATNRSLAAEVDRGAFREDLYYRLAVGHIEVPPLRERPEDIPMLVGHFLRELSAREGTELSLAPAVVRGLQDKAWQGNVRELRNAVERSLFLGTEVAEGDRVEAPPQAPLPTPDLSIPLKEARDRLAEAFERDYIRLALRTTGGNVSRAAELAGVNRKFIQRALKRYGLRDE